MSKPGTPIKTHIIDAVIEQNRYTPNKTIETVEILLEIITRCLKSGDDILISGFGKSCLKKKRRGRNPATEEDMMLKSQKVLTFQCSGRLRKKLNRD